ncbi:MAG: phytase [Cyanobacteriota bacterium]|nr:phytase [Cyanobacteriota bacterium]
MISFSSLTRWCGVLCASSLVTSLLITSCSDSSSSPTTSNPSPSPTFTATPNPDTGIVAQAETPNIIDADGSGLGRVGDADDPAIYIHPGDPSLSFFLATFKEGGMAVYDLAGNELQFIDPDYGAPNSGRFNNVDLRYNFPLGGENVDIAVATERNNNTIRIFRIDANARQIIDITADSVEPNLFPDFLIDNEEGASYGLTMYKSPISGKFFVFVNSNDRGDIAQLELFDNGDGTIGATRVRTLNLPTQCEGMVTDDELGFLYVGEEDFGLWKFLAEPEAGTTGSLIDTAGGGNLEADVEGLSIYYTSAGRGYLLVSSQGDNTYAVYTREGGNSYLGSFEIEASEAIDSVEESDGSDVINVPLGSEFPFGAFVAHDGGNEPEFLVDDDGELENANSNFKIVKWEDIANSFSPPLEIDPSSYDPRQEF